MQADAFEFLDRWLLPTGPQTPLALLLASLADGERESTAAEIGRLEAWSFLCLITPLCSYL
jgi:hypothetical protein